MEHLDSILKLAENELEAIEKNGKFRSREEIDSVYKLIDIAKDIYCIWDYEEGMDDEMSYAGDGRSYRGRGYENSYDGGSYARGRGRNAKRDSMGRYSRNSYRGSYRGYSRDGGKEEFMESFREMMEDAPNDQTRQEMQRLMAKIEQM